MTPPPEQSSGPGSVSVYARTVRVTVRLRGREAERVDALLERLKADTRGTRWRKPWSPGRNYSWTRGDVLRLGIQALEEAIAASDYPMATGSSDDAGRLALERTP
jgi:hypothetical protein